LSSPANVAKPSKVIREEQYEVLLPAEYTKTQRLYPVLYFVGDFTPGVKEMINAQIGSSIADGSLTPVIAVYVSNSMKDIATSLVPAIEKKYRARAGWRFRALIGYEAAGATALQNALIPEVFTSCVLFDVPVDGDAWKSALQTSKKKLERTWYMFYNPDKGNNYKSNGNAHTFLRDEEVYHEYRVQQGKGGPEWMLSNLKEALNFTQRKIHR
jgi:enterochelin esterase-like enzyme